MSNLRRKFSASFKAKVAIEALQERETIEFLSKKTRCFIPTRFCVGKMN